MNAIVDASGEAKIEKALQAAAFNVRDTFGGLRLTSGKRAHGNRLDMDTVEKETRGTDRNVICSGGPDRRIIAFELLQQRARSTTVIDAATIR